MFTGGINQSLSGQGFNEIEKCAFAPSLGVEVLLLGVMPFIGWLAVIVVLIGISYIWFRRCTSPKNSTIFHAAQNGDAVDVKRHLRRGVDVDAKCKHNLTALHIAARCGHLEVAKVLLKKGAQPNLRSEHSATPLRIAKEKKHTEIVELLQRYGGKD